MLSCAEVCEPIELSFGVVSGVSLGIYVLDGVQVLQGEGTVSEVFHLHWFEWSIFCTEMYSTHALKIDNISICTVDRRNRHFTGFPKLQSSSRSMLGFKRNMQKFNSTFDLLAL